MSAESVHPDTLAALVEFVYNSEAQLSPESLIKLRDATSKLETVATFSTKFFVSFIHA